MKSWVICWRWATRSVWLQNFKIGCIELQAPVSSYKIYLSELQWIWQFKKSCCFSVWILSSSHSYVAFESKRVWISSHSCYLLALQPLWWLIPVKAWSCTVFHVSRERSSAFWNCVFQFFMRVVSHSLWTTGILSVFSLDACLFASACSLLFLTYLLPISKWRVQALFPFTHMSRRWPEE